MSQSDRLLTVQDVAQLLQVHDQTVRGYIREGRLRSIRLGRRAIRISQADFDDFIRRHQSEASQ